MNLHPASMTVREKMMLAGLFLAKFDLAGLKQLGFDSFKEAFNIIGYALGGKPASVKAYRDEFDPYFPNRRRGWHKRPLRDHCSEVLETYRGLDLDTFTGLIRALTGYDANLRSLEEAEKVDSISESAFAKRLATGLAAEHYFVSVHPTLPEFQSYALENTTRLGCGYDFRLSAPSVADFLAVEVKGMQGTTGNLSLTPKEYEVAGSFSDRYFLFVVKNFSERPFHHIYRNPMAAELAFTKKERVLVHVSWEVTV